MTRTPHPPAVTDRAVPLLLAVYGTLRRGCRNHHVLAGAEPVAEGHVAGALHEVVDPLGRPYSYPLLVLPAAGRAVVEVYRVRDPAVLAGLDALEAFDPDDVAGSEYVRVRVPLLGAGEAVQEASQEALQEALQVQVYAYAGSGDGVGAQLRDGDWTTHAGPLA